MAYAALADIKGYLLAGGQTPPTTDDALLTTLLARAQKIIEAKTGKLFEAATETRYFDVPHDRQLDLDKDLLSITTLTNGDGTVITSSSYYLLPRNDTPKYAIVLKQSADVAWEPDSDGNTEKVISVLGTWGYMAAASVDIVQATVRLAAWLYRQKDSSEDGSDRAIRTPDGSLILPSRLPQDVLDYLEPYLPRI
jgi:hypothetical protein